MYYDLDAYFQHSPKLLLPLGLDGCQLLEPSSDETSSADESACLTGSGLTGSYDTNAQAT